ncbi:MAG: heme-binding protein [Dehalococcoidales bacterium]|nr:heme-binding protein [Dehalococcoidales bacterium]
MYEMKLLGLAEAQVAAAAVLKEASKEASRPITVVVTDRRGDIIILCKMDGGITLFNTSAILKAHSASAQGVDTRQFFKNRMNKELSAEWGAYEPPGEGRTFVPGGVTIVEPGKPTVYGGIGVGGRKADEDEALAKVGLKALQDYLWPAVK